MDSNGYNKSLFNTHEGVCYYCHKGGSTIRHEVFHGTANREISKKVGTWLYLCPRCHAMVHAGVHTGGPDSPTIEEELQKEAEKLFRNAYSADFQKVFFGAPKRWELEALAKEVKKRERELR